MKITGNMVSSEEIGEFSFKSKSTTFVAIPVSLFEPA